MAWVEKLSAQAFQRGMSTARALPIIVAVLTAWTDEAVGGDADVLLHSFGKRLAGRDIGDGLSAATDWLTDPGFSTAEQSLADDIYRFLQQQALRPLDWNAEFAAILAPDLRLGVPLLSPLIARALVRIIDLPLNSSVACLYSASAALAWAMADEHDVTLFADHDLAIMVSLMARAAGRRIKVSRRNPMDGTFMPGPFLYESPKHVPPFDMFEHIVAVPPFGGRIEDGPSKGMAWETALLQRMPQRARRSFTALVPDGMLFRDTRAESELRQSLVIEYATSVMSLPSGMYGPRASVSASLLRLEHNRPGRVQVVDARTMKHASSGRVQEKLVAQHLSDFRGFRSEKNDRTRSVDPEEFADNGFSLLPERYLKSANLSLVEQILKHRPSFPLYEIADVERGRAPQPLRDDDAAAALSAIEIAPMDIVEGLVQSPSKQLIFDQEEGGRLQAVTVNGSDILVSIKGNVGNVGIASSAAEIAKLMEEPWIVSQSLAIVRLKPDNPYIPSADILHGLLTAPWVREKLESMSGGTTVRALPISALRNLMLPVPTAEECNFAKRTIEKISKRREQIADLRDYLAAEQKFLWEQLWQIPATAGAE